MCVRVCERGAERRVVWSMKALLGEELERRYQLFPRCRGRTVVRKCPRALGPVGGGPRWHSCQQVVRPGVDAVQAGWGDGMHRWGPHQWIPETAEGKEQVRS